VNIKLEDELKRLIAERANELSVKRGSSAGSEVDDWIKAEKEIMYELSLRSSRLFIEDDM
jgi:hypothetical protein